MRIAAAVIKEWGISVDTVTLITSASFGGMFQPPGANVWRLGIPAVALNPE